MLAASDVAAACDVALSVVVAGAVDVAGVSTSAGASALVAAAVVAAGVVSATVLVSTKDAVVSPASTTGETGAAVVSVFSSAPPGRPGKWPCWRPGWTCPPPRTRWKTGIPGGPWHAHAGTFRRCGEWIR